MGWFEKVFGKRAVPGSSVPRLVTEGPEFPADPIVLGRAVTPTQIEATLAGARFVRGQGDRWTRPDVVVEIRNENGVTLLAFSGSAMVEAQRELLAALAWINPVDGFYDAMRDVTTPIAELRYLIRALRHYRCVGGVPTELRRHADAEIQETIRLMERDQAAAAARAQRSRKKG